MLTRLDSRKKSFLQEPNRAGKLSAIIGTNKPFQISQPFLTKDGKHREERCDRHIAIVIKCERKVLYFKDIAGGRYCLSVAVSVFRCITNGPFKNQKINTLLLQSSVSYQALVSPTQMLHQLSGTPSKFIIFP